MRTADAFQDPWTYCNVLAAYRTLLGPPAWLRAGAGERDDLFACLAQAGSMSYGDYVEQMTYLLFCSAKVGFRVCFWRRVHLQ